MKLNYVLTAPSYFSKGPRGQVSHALGIIKGLEANGVQLTVISEENISSFLTDALGEVTFQHIKKSGRTILGDIVFSIRCLIQAKNNGGKLLIRKNIVTLILCLLTLNFRLLGIDQHIFWEVNGL